MNNNSVLKESRQLARSMGYTIRRSKTINKINGKACYEIVGNDFHYNGGLVACWQTLLELYNGIDFKGLNEY